METITILRALGILIVFIAAVVVMMTKKVPTILVLPAMAILFAVIAGVPFMSSNPKTITISTSILQQGSMRLSDAMAGLIFGAWFSSVLNRLNITKGIVKKAAELAGDKPMATAFVFYIAATLIFLGGNNLGMYILVGNIIIPIMITTGVSPFNAGLITILAGTAGGSLNVTNWLMPSQVYGVPVSTIQHYIWFSLIPFMLISIAMIFFFTKKDAGRRKAWAMPTNDSGNKGDAPLISFITPIVPVVLVFAFKMDIVTAVIIAVLVGLLLTWSKKPIHIMASSMIEGVQDVTGALMLFVGIGMLLVSVSAPQVTAVIKPAIDFIIPNSVLGYILFFTLLAPLAIYRGPLNLFGLGAGIAQILIGSGMSRLGILIGMDAVGKVQGVSDPTNSYTVWIADFTKTEVTDYMKKTLPFIMIGVAITTIIAMPIVLH